MNYWIKTAYSEEPFAVSADSEIAAAKKAAQIILFAGATVLRVNNLGLCADAYLAYGANGETIRFEIRGCVNG